MGKKLTYELVFDSFAKEGYSLLSKSYINAHTKLDYVCAKGHKHFVTWANWKSGHRCTYCAGTAKPTLDIVKSSFEKFGYTLLSKGYTNAHTKLKYICPNNHEGSVTWKNWKNGRRCNKCAINNRRKDFSLIKKSFESHGYALLSTEYKNTSSCLSYICPNGHKHKTTWKLWHQGKRCPYCAGNAKPTYSFVKESFEKEDYILLSKEYKNNRTKLDYICSNGHKHSMSWDNWQAGNRCVYCAGKAKLEIKDIELAFSKENYTLTESTYKNNRTRISYICPVGHKHRISWSDWQAGHRCPICASIKMVGSGNPSWKGGKSFEHYCHIWTDREFKSDIRARDGHSCLNPYCYGGDRLLHIHHIDYDKKNCHPSNLITVCRSCNLRANADRDWHKQWYQAIMNKRYNYNY